MFSASSTILFTNAGQLQEFFNGTALRGIGCGNTAIVVVTVKGEMYLCSFLPSSYLFSTSHLCLSSFVFFYLLFFPFSIRIDSDSMRYSWGRDTSDIPQLGWGYGDLSEVSFDSYFIF